MLTLTYLDTSPKTTSKLIQPLERLAWTNAQTIHTITIYTLLYHSMYLLTMENLRLQEYKSILILIVYLIY